MQPIPSSAPFLRKWKTKLLTEIKTDDVRYKCSMSHIHNGQQHVTKTEWTTERNMNNGRKSLKFDLIKSNKMMIILEFIVQRPLVYEFFSLLFDIPE